MVWFVASDELDVSDELSVLMVLVLNAYEGLVWFLEKNWLKFSLLTYCVLLGSKKINGRDGSGRLKFGRNVEK